MGSIHPTQSDFKATLRDLVPEGLADYLGGVAAASSTIWDQGGVSLVVMDGKGCNWHPGLPAPRELLLEFFACVSGDRLLERKNKAAPVLDGFESALGLAYPGHEIHLEVDPDEPSWCYTLHALVGPPSDPVKYIRLFWSVD